MITDVSFHSESSGEAEVTQNPRYKRLSWFRNLGVFVTLLFACAVQSFQWQLYADVPFSFMQSFGWKRFTVVFMANYSIVSGFASIPVGYMYLRFGVRNATIICLSVLTISWLVRCFPAPKNAYLGLTYFGGFLQGISTPAFYFTFLYCTCVVYFQSKRHSLIYIIASVAVNLGVAVSYLIFPVMVTEPILTENGTVVNKPELQSEIFRAIYLNTGLTVAALVAVVFTYYRSETAPLVRQSLGIRGVKQLLAKMLKKKDFWIFGLLAGWLTSICFSLIPSLYTLISGKGFHLTQRTIGVISAIATTVACLAGTALDFTFTRLHPRVSKAATLGIYLLAQIGGIWFLLMYFKKMSFTAPIVQLSKLRANGPYKQCRLTLIPVLHLVQP